jgi:hypothetical protein
MARKLKVGKFAVVVFLTLLIWVWADLALDETYPLSKVVTITIAKSTDPALWSSFTDANGLPVYAVPIKDVELKGPASKVAEFKGMLNKGQVDPVLFWAPQREHITEPGEYSLDVPAFLKQSDTIRQLGLTVESCEPQKIPVRIVRLVEQEVAVECLDENGVRQTPKSISPPRVKAFVPEDLTLTAKVRLSRAQIEQARGPGVQVTPYIELPGRFRREIPTPVKVLMPPPGDVLGDFSVTKTTLYVAKSPALEDTYRVEVTNLRQVLGDPIDVRATAEAKRTYEEQPLPLMILYIFDNDAKKGEGRRAVEYNFPAEFVARGEIELNQAPAMAEFRLIRLPSAEGRAGGVD